MNKTFAITDRLGKASFIRFKFRFKFTFFFILLLRVFISFFSLTFERHYNTLHLFIIMLDEVFFTSTHTLSPLLYRIYNPHSSLSLSSLFNIVPQSSLHRNPRTTKLPLPFRIYSFFVFFI